MRLQTAQVFILNLLLFALTATIATLATSPVVHAQAQEAAAPAVCAPWLDHRIGQLHSGEVIDLCAETAGKPVLIINTASYCGYTYQFSGLEDLYQRYKDKGLVVIGFPSDDFNQEDDDAAKTAEICYINHGVTFLMTDVVHVRRGDVHPVFEHLARESARPDWNFNKYLVDRNGNLAGLFRSNTEPDSARLTSAIEAVL